jgi:DNA-binding NarL/FixJ family response regulator
VCGEAADGRDAVQKCRQLKPDLLILDISMPELNGLDAARQILKHNPSQAILVLTAVDSEDVIRECLEAGIRGWVFKSEATHDLMTAVEALQQQKTIFSSRVSDMIMDGYMRHRVSPVPDKLTRLSPREREVVQLVSEGKASKDIATILRMSLSTAETHRSNIFRKLRLHSIAELVLYAVRNGLVHVHLPPVVHVPRLQTNRFVRPAAPGYLPACKPGNGLSSVEAEGVN